GVGPSGSRAEQPRELRHDRAVRHVVEALVDDPEALLDLVDPDEVAGQAVALVACRDVELELRKDAVRVRPAEVEGHAARSEVRTRDGHPQRRLAIERAEATHSADEDLVLVQEPEVVLDLRRRPGHPVAEAAEELVVEIAVDAADPE